MKKIIKQLFVGSSALLLFSSAVPSVAILNNSAQANIVGEFINDRESGLVSQVEFGKHYAMTQLFSEVIEQRQASFINSYSVDGYFVTELLDEENNVIVSEIINSLTGSYTTVTSNVNGVIIETGEADSSDSIALNRETFKFNNRESLFINAPQLIIPNPAAGYPVYGWGPWEYTGLAVGKKVFAATVALPTEAIFSYVAAIFGINPTAASHLISYMGAWGLTGDALADHFDTNGNGWIGLYKRKLKYYDVWGHRTY